MDDSIPILILFAIGIIVNAISAIAKKARENQSGGDWEEIEFDEPAPPPEGGVVEIPGFPGLTLRLEPPKPKVKPKPRLKAPPPIPKKQEPALPAPIEQKQAIKVTRRARRANRRWNQATLRKAIIAREILNRPRCFDV
jgi:hypothetical protein